MSASQPARERCDGTGVTPPVARRNVTPSLLACILYVLHAGVLASLAGSLALAVYALSFWHYLLYGLAFRYGAIPLRVFKRDAVLMKSIALAMLALAYLSTPIDLLSLTVVVAGFLLTTVAACVLGADRTYYGREVANLPPLQVTRFPFSYIAHPMLMGNVVAHGGTLLNAEFRLQWWPLACAHVAMNLALVAMERRVAPLGLRHRATQAAVERCLARPSATRVIALVGGGAALGGGAACLGAPTLAPIAALLGGASVAYGLAMYIAYTPPGPRAKEA